MLLVYNGKTELDAVIRSIYLLEVYKHLIPRSHAARAFEGAHEEAWEVAVRSSSRP